MFEYNDRHRYVNIRSVRWGSRTASELSSPHPHSMFADADSEEEEAEDDSEDGEDGEDGEVDEGADAEPPFGEAAAAAAAAVATAAAMHELCLRLHLHVDL